MGQEGFVSMVLGAIWLHALGHPPYSSYKENREGLVYLCYKLNRERAYPLPEI